MPPNPRKTGQCIICNFLKKNPKSDINRRIMQGDSIASIAKDTGFYCGTLSKHAGRGTGKDGLPRKPHFARQFVAAHKAMEERAGLDLAECAKEVYDMSIKAGKIALGDLPCPASADIRSFGSCMAPAAKVVEVFAKVSGDKDDDVPGIDRAIAKMKESRDGQ